MFQPIYHVSVSPTDGNGPTQGVHCLRVTCASSLFNAGVEEKLIQEWTGHGSDSLFKYEKPRKEKITEVSSVLAPSTSATEVKISEEKEKLFDEF